jgi:hypothetical protein
MANTTSSEAAVQALISKLKQVVQPKPMTVQEQLQVMIEYEQLREAEGLARSSSSIGLAMAIDAAPSSAYGAAVAATLRYLSIARFSHIQQQAALPTTGSSSSSSSSSVTGRGGPWYLFAFESGESLEGSQSRLEVCSCHKKHMLFDRPYDCVLTLPGSAAKRLSYLGFNKNRMRIYRERCISSDQMALTLRLYELIHRGATRGIDSRFP